MCGDTIATPVCHRCMQGEVEKWLYSRSPVYVSHVRRASGVFGSYANHGDANHGADCILCGQGLGVCTKCFCIAAHKALRGNSILASEFLDFASSKGFLLTSVNGVLSLKR